MRQVDGAESVPLPIRSGRAVPLARNCCHRCLLDTCLHRPQLTCNLPRRLESLKRVELGNLSNTMKHHGRQANGMICLAEESKRKAAQFMQFYTVLGGVIDFGSKLFHLCQPSYSLNFLRRTVDCNRKYQKFRHISNLKNECSPASIGFEFGNIRYVTRVSIFRSVNVSVSAVTNSDLVRWL